MKFNIVAAAVTGGVGLVIVLVGAGVLNMLFEGYAASLLDVISSVYPGYNADGSPGDLLVGCFYAAADGAIGGGGLALLYNLAVSLCSKK